jgi:hypothetical protein
MQWKWWQQVTAKGFEKLSINDRVGCDARIKLAFVNQTMSDQLLEKLYKGAQATSAKDRLDLASAALPAARLLRRRGKVVLFGSNCGRLVDFRSPRSPKGGTSSGTAYLLPNGARRLNFCSSKSSSRLRIQSATPPRL